ncbi:MULTISPECIES: TetR/AcrR family transcriptional regulator [Streptomyces]|uniref:DNA-binding transcriptional regulator, AcrR family n=1 Tax=Streptomyces misionensis TaxID=67331 RepID=A0A1H4MI07_9ACTN|nr:MULTISPECIES: TetR/AcrR family transcriptional regulator [Streptomyces]SEB81982.1 DNA-binding transcriptional regulator, AcrR family [Streptomyces misionensis]SFY49744.1 HTH-type transcriptional repressor FabR [Streptomyces sp. F-1]
MSHRPFHHGNLRTVLLEQAEVVLRERGIDALSLRELAREAGVSHGAPRSHFIDRGALLDALAERGFIRLADQIREAASRVPEDHARVLHAAASAYLAFAERDPALLDLMFATKVGEPSEAVRGAAERLFGTMADIMNAGVEAGAYDADDVGRLTLLLSATVQGIAALVTSRRITASQGEALVDDAIRLFLKGASAG